MRREAIAASVVAIVFNLLWTALAVFVIVSAGKCAL